MVIIIVENRQKNKPYFVSGKENAQNCAQFWAFLRSSLPEQRRYCRTIFVLFTMTSVFSAGVLAGNAAAALSYRRTIAAGRFSAVAHMGAGLTAIVSVF